MRIKKFLSGFLAVVMCISSMCISSISSAAAANEETETKYYYTNNFNAAEDVANSKVNIGYLAKEQVFNNEETEGYLKLHRGNIDVGTMNLQLVDAESKNMFVEFDVSSDSTEGVFQSFFRMQSADKKEYRLVFVNGTGVYKTADDMRNKTNPIANHSYGWHFY